MGGTLVKKTQQCALHYARDAQTLTVIIVSPFPEGGNRQGKDIQTMIEVLSKAFRLDLLPQISIGGGENPDIRDAAFRRPQGAILPKLQEAQELNLRGMTEGINFIEEQGATFRFSHEAFFCGGRIGKGALPGSSLS
jgi:hypothetical protein